MIEREEISRRTYAIGYHVRREIWTTGYPEDTEPQEHRQAYNREGQWIGRPAFAWRLFRKHGIYPEYRTSESTVCSIGFCEREQKWYGWSHRAIVGFGIGDKLFTEGFPDPDGTIPFIERGTVTITALEEARQAAANFAEYVS
jgi:hypothetical protein